MGQTGDVRKIVSGSFLTMGLSYVSRGTNMVAEILLTRLLLPEDFAYLAWATLYFMLFASLKEFGLSYALLHYHDRAEEMAPTHLLLNTGLACIGLGIAVAAALLLRAYYAQQIIYAMLIFSAFDILRSATLTPESLLRKAFAFSRLAIIQSVSVLISLVAALTLAWAGYGFWALIIGYSRYSIIYVVTFSLLVWLSRPLSFRGIRFRPDLARPLFSFGTRYWVSGMLSLLTLHYDKFIVGILQGDKALGIFERAYTFAQKPTGAITHMIIGITNAVYARYQHDRQKLSAVFSKIFGIILRISAPVVLVLFMQADNLTLILVKEEWVGLAPLLRWLVVYALIKPMQDDVHSLLLALGQPKKIMQFAFVQAAILVVLAPVLAHLAGLAGVAMAVNIMVLIGTVLLLRCATGYVDVPWRRMVIPPAIAILLAAGTSSLIGGLHQLTPPWLRLIAEIGILLSVYALALLAIEGKRLFRELRMLYAVWTGATPPRPD